MDSGELPALVVPGQPICSSREYSAGTGVYVDEQAVSDDGGMIISALLGKVIVLKNETGASPAGGDKSTSARSRDSTTIRSFSNLSKRADTYDSRPKVSVVRPKNAANASKSLPDVNDIVLARVTRINPRQANVAILAVSESKMDEEYGGIIRAVDVRETEKDKVKMQACYKPGDIIRAQVISLGDGSSYYLTTARNDLGVVFATSESCGAPMYPIDWRSMKCTVSGAIEERKCAKPT
ncbi:hypothetical protein V1511DRAFT_497463 [Dipodascopsis uninucleata]